MGTLFFSVEYHHWERDELNAWRLEEFHHQLIGMGHKKSSMIETKDRNLQHGKTSICQARRGEKERIGQNWMSIVEATYFRPMDVGRSVSIEEDGRSGKVRYNELGRELVFYWEFGGGDVVAIVHVGTEAEWLVKHAWAADRRAGILHFIGDELVRQRAPGCKSELDEYRGDILIRQNAVDPLPDRRSTVSTGGTTPKQEARADAAAWMKRRSALRAKLGSIVLIGGLLVAAFFWMKQTFLVIDPGTPAPLGQCVRTDKHIATLLQQLEPYTPSLHRDASKDRYRLSVMLIPLDGSDPVVVPISGGHSPNTYSLGRILGSDGHTLWLDAAGLYGVALADNKLLAAQVLQKANPTMDAMWWEDTSGMEVIDGRLVIIARDRSQAFAIDPATLKATPTDPKHTGRSPIEPQLTSFLAAGCYISPTAWLGLHSTADLEGSFKSKRWVRPVESADDAKEMRKLCLGRLDPVSDHMSHQILSMTALGSDEYLNAAFLRMDEKSEPIRVSGPDGVVMLHTSAPGSKGTLMIARVDNDGAVRWNVDTMLDRFKLSQILPGDASTAFVGTRLPVPDKVGEPLVVIVDHRTGEMVVRSFWH